MRSMVMPSRSHHTESLDRLNNPFGEAKGTPLSERIARGIPSAGQVRYVHSPYGHDGFLIEEAQVGALVADFLADEVPAT